VLNIVSNRALSSDWLETNATLPARLLVQRLRNPANFEFDVVTLKHSEVVAGERAFTESTWFVGYLWRIATCPVCKRHLGWRFESDDGFLSLARRPEGRAKWSNFTVLILSHVRLQTEVVALTWSAPALVSSENSTTVR